MRIYILRRLLVMPILLLGVITVAFIISRTTNANPLASIINERQLENPEVVAAAKARWGLDRSLPEQYVIYVGNLLQGDMGTSFRTKRPVSEDLRERLPATLELVVSAMLVASVTGVVFGVAAARRRGSMVDYTVRILALLGSAVPVFWSGLLFLYLFAVKLQVFPVTGRLDPRTMPPEFHTGLFTVDALIDRNWPIFIEACTHLILPSLVLGWSVLGIVARVVRASMLDVLDQDFILMARAKGASEIRVLTNHALRNALVPVITIIAFSFAYLITGAVLTEAVFAWPGIGSYAVESARAIDYPAILGVTLIAGVSFLLTNLVADICYVIVDPRIRTGHQQ